MNLLLDEGFHVSKLFHVQDFAKLAGVTVRALHHYHRWGLVKPNRTEAGYRLYCLRDLERLEQIVALKFLGIPLKQIRQMFQHGTNEMSESLRMQRRVLEEKRRLLVDTLGIEPGPALHELQRAILAQDTRLERSAFLTAAVGLMVGIMFTAAGMVIPLLLMMPEVLKRAGL